ncbi:hypothetical protein [Mesorhizobium sp.]|uniref:hypothetical protein n=1 Tax=Mesorhizobium sp. TaxID=1871066 RepID=UPI0012118509|nr:hypothetical protein [Mesorhizobium sp.]TIL33917.1 MAG: hypothetical protein E5Y85_12050 [Mesorhizobium sp.]
MKSRQKKIHLAPRGAETNSRRSIFRTSEKNRKDDDIQKLGKRLRKRDGVAKVLIEFRSEFSDLSQGYHNHVRESTIAVYAAALLLREDRSSWAEFCRHSDWRKRKRLAPRVAHPEDALRATARLVVGFKERATRRSSRLYKLLEPFFAGATPMREVAAIARDGGLKGLAEVGATFKNEKKAAPKAKRSPACRFTFENRKMATKISSVAAGTKLQLFGKVKKSKSGAVEIILHKITST